MKKIMLLLSIVAIVSCNRTDQEIQEQNQKSLTEQDEVIGKSIVIVDNQYKLTISLFDAMLQGVTKERYEFTQAELSKENDYVKESLSKGYKVVFAKLGKDKSNQIITKDGLYFLGDFTEYIGSQREFYLPGGSCLDLWLNGRGITIHGDDYNDTVVFSTVSSSSPVCVIHWHCTHASSRLIVSRVSESITSSIYYKRLGRVCDY